MTLSCLNRNLKGLVHTSVLSVEAIIGQDSEDKIILPVLLCGKKISWKLLPKATLRLQLSEVCGWAPEIGIFQNECLASVSVPWLSWIVGIVIQRRNSVIQKAILLEASYHLIISVGISFYSGFRSCTNDSLITYTKTAFSQPLSYLGSHFKAH